MMTDPMPEPEGPDDERFDYVVMTAGVGAAGLDSEREGGWRAATTRQDAVGHSRLIPLPAREA